MSLAIGGVLMAVMYVWMRAHFIKQRLTDIVGLTPYAENLIALSNDETVPKYATHWGF